MTNADYNKWWDVIPHIPPLKPLRVFECNYAVYIKKYIFRILFCEAIKLSRMLIIIIESVHLLPLRDS